MPGTISFHPRKKEICERISRTMKAKGVSAGPNNPMYGKFGAEHPNYGKKYKYAKGVNEGRAHKLSEGAKRDKRFVGSKNGMFGRRHSAEARAKMSQALRDRDRTSTETKEQWLICKRCKSIIAKTMATGYRVLLYKRAKRLCAQCAHLGRSSGASKPRSPMSADSKISNSDRMRLNNPMKNPEIRAKVSSTLKRRYAAGEIRIDLKRLQKMRSSIVNRNTPETRSQMSERMKRNNPMKRADIKEKVSKAIRAKIAKGEIKYATGPRHHCWRGNRRFNLVVRSRLYKVWIFPILASANFQCQRCGRKNKIHVHHLKPLRLIIAEEMGKMGLKSTENLEPEVHEHLVLAILEAHKNVKGEVLCKNCHRKVDPRYRCKEEPPTS